VVAVFIVVVSATAAKVVSKAIPVTGRGDPWGCETSRIPHFIDSLLTDGGEVVSLTRRPRFIPQKDSWCSFLLEAESNPRPSRSSCSGGGGGGGGGRREDSSSCDDTGSCGCSVVINIQKSLNNPVAISESNMKLLFTFEYILWHVDPLLGNYHEICYNITIVAK
jgi:hypothetical protein